MANKTCLNGALPAGLSPVVAGRLGLWLLSRRAMARSRKRDIGATRRIAWGQKQTLARRYVALVAPWPVSLYPGSARVLAALLGVSHATGRRYLKSDRDVPAAHYERMARDLEARAAMLRALAAELIQLDAAKSRNREIKLSGNQHQTGAIKVAA